MSNQMNKSARNWLILVTLVVVAILAALWATTTIWFPLYPFEPHERPPLEIFGDIELFYTIKTVVSTINVTLLIFLLLTYINIYRKTRSEFTVGLIIFSGVFLLNALASNPFVIWSLRLSSLWFRPVCDAARSVYACRSGRTTLPEHKILETETQPI